MKLAISVALLGAGAVLIVLGFTAMDSFSSDVSRFFTGTPTNKAVWMLIAGTVMALAGLTLTLRSRASA
jgi:divalent metal cation (Fe/Co/Zn/Cd) transporter